MGFSIKKVTGGGGGLPKISVPSIPTPSLPSLSTITGGGGGSSTPAPTTPSAPINIPKNIFNPGTGAFSPAPSGGGAPAVGGASGVVGKVPGASSASNNGLSGLLGALGGGNDLSGLLGMLNGGGGGAAGGLGGIIGNTGAGNGGINTNLGSIFGNTPGNVMGGLFNGKTDPWNIFHKKDQVNSTGEVESAIDKYSAQSPYKSILDKNGALPDNLKANAFNIQNTAQITPTTTNAAGPDQTALSTMRNIATSTGDSPWATMQKKGIEQSRMQQQGQADQAAMGNAATARSDLAMHGGLESGAGERIAENQQRSLDATKQGINTGAMNANTNVGISDAGNKMNMLGQTAGLDLSNANFGLGQAQFNVGQMNNAAAANAGAINSANAYNVNANNAAESMNIGNTIAGTNAGNDYNLGMFQTKMQGYGSAKSADAIQNAGKK